MLTKINLCLGCFDVIHTFFHYLMTYDIEFHQLIVIYKNKYLFNILPGTNILHV